VVRGYAWSLVYAISAYAILLRLYFRHFNRKEVRDIVGRVVDFLDELDKLSPSLGVIAWAHALTSALRYEYVRRLMKEALRIDVVGKDVIDKVSEVLKELNDKKERVQELMGDEEFMSYIESEFVKAGEEAVKKVILTTALLLKHEVVRYRFINDELIEERDLFNEIAREYREIGDYRNYLIDSGWALRVKAIKDSLVGEKLVDGFRQLYEETFNEEHFKLTARYLSIASARLSNYLVSLALTGNYEKINELLEEHLWVLNADKQVSVLTRLTLNALLSPRGGLSSDLEGKLSVNPKELINAFGSHMYREFLPALGVAFGMTRPDDGYEECMLIEDSTERRDCRGAVLIAADDSDAVGRLRGRLINGFHKRILERSGWLRKLGFDTNKLISEFEKLVYGLDGKSLVQLIAPSNPMAQLALMLRALINGNKELAKALALYGGTYTYSSKLLRRLFLEVYKECCDLESEEFRLALARLLFLLV